MVMSEFIKNLDVFEVVSPVSMLISLSPKAAEAKVQQPKALKEEQTAFLLIYF
jgi:hypothetical protein